jgi:hypothetical protein
MIVTKAPSEPWIVVKRTLTGMLNEQSHSHDIRRGKSKLLYALDRIQPSSKLGEIAKVRGSTTRQGANLLTELSVSTYLE